MNYVIGDFVIQLKNAALAHRKAVVAPYANMSKAVAQVLKKEGFVEAISEETIDGKRMLSVSLGIIDESQLLLILIWSPSRPFGPMLEQMKLPASKAVQQ